MEKIKSAGRSALEFIKKHKKVIIPLAIVLVAGSVYLRSRGSTDSYDMQNAIMASETSVVSHGDFEEVITENGQIVSENSTTIYPELQAKITQVSVEVGDEVKKGDVIARLDDSEIQQKIKESELAMGESAQARALQIESAQANLNRALRDSSAKNNPELRQAQTAINQAYDNWQRAIQALEAYKARPKDDAPVSPPSQPGPDMKQMEQKVANFNQKKEEDQGRITRLQDQISQKEDKKDALMEEIKANDMAYVSHADLLNAKTKLDQLKNQYKSEEAGNEDMVKLIEKLESAIRAMEQVEVIMEEILTLASQSDQIQLKLIEEEKLIQEGLNEIYQAQAQTSQMESPPGGEDELLALEQQAKDAEYAYTQAIDSLEATKIAASDQIEDLRRNLKEASQGGSPTESLSIQYLRDQLQDTSIKAPIDGTITDVNMTLGEVPEGFVAKIETVDRTLVHSSVKEYDINTITEGMDVEITANSLGTDQVFTGKVELVYPTPSAGGSSIQAQEMGPSQDGGGISYKAIINFDDDNDMAEIHPGMNVRVRYIIQKQEDVITVPSSSVVEMGDETFLFVLDEKTSQVESIEVAVKAKNEFQSVISSPDLKDGMRYINNPQMYAPGQKLELIEDQAMDGDMPMEMEEGQEDMGHLDTPTRKA